MKLTLTTVLALCMMTTQALAQTNQDYRIRLHTGLIDGTPQLKEETVLRLNTLLLQQPVVAIIQFQQPVELLKNTAQLLPGVQVLSYLGNYAYFVKVEQPLSAQQMKAAGTRSLFLYEAAQKVAASLRLLQGDTTVYCKLFPFITIEEAIALLEQKGLKSEKAFDELPVLKIVLSSAKLMELASLPFVEFIEPLPAPVVELNDKSLDVTKANILQSAPYGLTGEGTVFQIAEITDLPQHHLDFSARSIIPWAGGISYHNTHVTGIAAGAGLINERYKGFSPKAKFISTSTGTGSFPNNILNYGVDLGNHAYGSGRGCLRRPFNNVPYMLADKQAIDFSGLIHVYAAGNYGENQCPVYPPGYNTIDINNQSSKSVLTVGAVNASGEIASFSSRGPAAGGRFKPEIVTQGALVWSTVPDNIYFTNNGTSMAAPAAMGGLGLLYQRYRQLYNGAQPPNALMKPLLCNTATDRGNPGPDYLYGFGIMNLNRAVKALDAHQYFTDSAGHGQQRNKTIAIPPATAQLKVMLYWQDPPIAPASTRTILNDLDLKVVSTDGTIFFPLVTDTAAALVANTATQREDHTNNIEQVVIDNPQAGNYTIMVNGFEIGEGPYQSYYVVYDIVPEGLEITSPALGQSVAAGETVKVQWDAANIQSSGYQLEFSADDGQSWQMVNGSIAAGSMNTDWTAPAIATNQARLRLKRISGDGSSDTSDRFQVLGVPLASLSPNQCPGSIHLEWNSIPGATDYELMRYRGGEMVSVGFTTQTSFVFRGLALDSTYWVTVRAKLNAQPGRRAIALSRKPDNGNCADAAFDSDVQMEDLLSPLFGRQFTSQHLSAERFKIRLRNRDNVPVTGYTISYSVNGRAWVSEAVGRTLPAADTIEHFFTTPFVFAQPGVYNIRLAVHHLADADRSNDTLSYQLRYVANDVISLNTVVKEDLETHNPSTYAASKQGLTGLDRFDYEQEGITGHLKIGRNYSFSPSNAFELSGIIRASNILPGTQRLTATYNLSLFDTAIQSVYLDFACIGGGDWQLGALDSVLIRGNDQSNWIVLRRLNQTSSVVNQLFHIEGLAITDSLRAHRQSFSSSFQVRWSPRPIGTYFLIDSIRLYDSGNDLALLSIDSLLPYSCGLSANVPINITIVNRGMQAAQNIVARYRINNGMVLSQTIPSISAKDTLRFRFTQPADLSAIGSHIVESWIEYAGDHYTLNNKKALSLRNQPLVRTLPQVEDFENSNGNWYTGGIRSSWQWGTPATKLINGAASGVKAWKTNLAGSHNPQELSQLYTGCYDLSQLIKPMASMSVALNTDSCPLINLCDVLLSQYSTDGANWLTLPPSSNFSWPSLLTAKNWYRWHSASKLLPANLKTVQFRFQFRSDFYNTFEGIGIDDFHIYDSVALIYDSVSSSMQRSITGGQEWMDFRNADRVFAAIQPNGKDLGDVQVQTFFERRAIRNFHGQYYLGRNFIVRTSKAKGDSLLVRLYFTDSQSDSLLFARNCTTCTKPPHAYRFGVSTYTSVEANEIDSAISNNKKGEWAFIPAAQVKTVPFVNGYYMELKVKEGTELRLSNGGLDGLSDLPVVIQQLSAAGNTGGAIVEWTTKSEINLQRFEVEVARGNESYQLERFEKVGEVLSRGKSALPQSYLFTDNSTGKAGILYYRIRSVDVHGNASYSKVVPVIFTEELNWVVYPNPSKGLFTLVYQAAVGEQLTAQLYNSVGQLMKTLVVQSNGFVQQTDVDLRASQFAAGVYYLKIQGAQANRLLKLVKQ